MISRKMIAPFLALTAFVVCPGVADDVKVSMSDRALAEVLKDAPIGLWTFDGSDAPSNLQNVVSDEPQWRLQITGGPKFGLPGPRPSEFPDFSPNNNAMRLSSGANYLRLTDPGDGSPLDFTNGDSITLECWVQWDEPLQGNYPYLIGKGRTKSGDRNQNYALRLANSRNGVFPTLLFADADTTPSKAPGGNEWHRWTATAGVPEDGGWHHVALSYTFGDPKSIVAYVDGTPSKGKWDMGGETKSPPVVDDDEFWIGSSMGGGSTFNGSLDNVAIYRRLVPADRIRSHARINLSASAFALGKIGTDIVPNDRVRVELMPGAAPVARSWKFRTKPMELLYETDTFALNNLPHAYNKKGLIIDRPQPFLIHLSTKLHLTAGEYEFVVHSLDSTRLYVDGELLTETPFMQTSTSAHGKYYDLPDNGDVLSLSAGHSEKRAAVTLSEGTHVISLYRLVGNKGKSPHLGELSLAIGPVGGPYQFVSPTEQTPYTDAGWMTLRETDRVRRRDWEQQTRAALGKSEQEYWNQRHDYARSTIIEQRGIEQRGEYIPLTSQKIDLLIGTKLTAEGEKPMPLIDDMAFLRRLTLDTLGTIPTRDQVEAYLADSPETRRDRAIERMLSHPEWADHWVTYWQDILAENPGLTKPQLNNTGPFRWFLYEAMLDNKPLDRFVTELILMEGSKYEGGPAGFEMSSQK